MSREQFGGSRAAERKTAQRLRLTAHYFGGGVWESNPPAPALTVALTVLKTAPLTRTGAPPSLGVDSLNLCARRRACQAQGTRARRLTRVCVSAIIAVKHRPH